MPTRDRDAVAFVRDLATSENRLHPDWLTDVDIPFTVEMSALTQSRSRSRWG